MAYTLHTNQMDKNINNFLKAYGAENIVDKKQIITKLIQRIGESDKKSKNELVQLIKSLSKKFKSEDDDLAIIRKIVEEID